MIRKASVLMIAIVFLAGAAIAATASAGNVHLKGGKNAQLVFTDKGLTLSASGDLAGLGNGDILVTLSATGNPTATCTNPGGKKQPPGQNPAPVVLTGVQSLPQSQIKNGTVHFGQLITNAPVSPIPGAPGCPNHKWTEAITNVSFTSAAITVEQPAGTVVLTLTCTFTPATSDGTVPKGNISCQ